MADRLYQLKLLRQVLGIEWAEPVQRLDHRGGDPFRGAVRRTTMHDPVAHRGQCVTRDALLNVVHQGLSRRPEIGRFHNSRQLVARKETIDPQHGLRHSNPADFTVQDPSQRIMNAE